MPYEKLDLSAKEWFRKHNRYTIKKVRRYYNVLIDEKKLELKQEQTELKYKKKILSRQQIAELKNKIKFLKKEETKLQHLLKVQLKELEIADKQILDYKNFKYYFKNLSYFIEEINSNLPKNKRISVVFLIKYKKYSTNKILTPQELSETNFKKKKSELIKEAKRQFNIAKRKYCYPEFPWWRKFLAFFGKPYLKGIRESRSGKIYDYVDEKLKRRMEKLEYWMEDLLSFSSQPEKLTLADLIIPGSHDTGTYTMRPVTNTDIVGKISQTQTGNVIAQLKAGVRRLDLRFREVNGVLVIFHGIVNGGSVLEVIDGIVKFLREHPKEIIFISVKATRKDIEKFRHIKRVKDTFLPLIYWPGPEGEFNIRDITLYEILDEGKQILIWYIENIKNFSICNITLRTFYPKIRQSGNDQILIDKEEEYAKAKSKDKLISISPIHTPGIKTILKGSVHSRPVEEAVKGSFLKNMEELDKRLNGEWPNIVSSDNSSHRKVSKFTERLVDLNKKRIPPTERNR